MAEVMPESVDKPIQQQSLPNQLGAKERYWLVKAIIRTVICVINLVAIGCAAWIIAKPLPRGYYSLHWDDSIAIATLVVLFVSILWCLCYILIPLVLKPPRPLHPGISVGVDLIFWLAFIVVGTFCLAIVFRAFSWGSEVSYIDSSYGSYSYGSYSGHYTLAPNNTLVWEFDWISGDGQNNRFYNYTSGQYEYYQPDASNITRTCYQFSSCEAQDAAVNRAWRQRPTRIAVSVLVDAVAWLDMVLHFVLFVWACVDTHRYNRSRNSERDRYMAEKLIEDMEKRGLITVNPTTQLRDPTPNFESAPPQQLTSPLPPVPLQPPITISQSSSTSRLSPNTHHNTDPDAITPAP